MTTPTNPKQWTNSSVRKLLGEKGYNYQGLITDNDEGVFSKWARGDEVVYLVEYHDNAPPRLYDHASENIDPDSLTVRNVNIQNEGSPDE